MHEALQFFLYLRSAVSLAFIATVASLVSVVLLSVVLQRVDQRDGGSACPAIPSTADTTSASAGYLCKAPDSYRALAYSKLWITLGDSFVSGVGVDSASNWLALLQANVRLHTGSTPVVLNAADEWQGSTLAQQIASVQQSADYSRLLQSGDSALVFVSYGMAELQAIGSQTNIGALADELDALFAPQSGNWSAAKLYVLLLLRADPVHGGVRIPPALITCPPTLHSLNYPSVDSLQLHRALYDTQRALYSTLQRKYQCALVDVDAALGAFSWPMSLTRSACAFADCEVYNALGHLLLADLLWHCMQRQVYNVTMLVG